MIDTVASYLRYIAESPMNEQYKSGGSLCKAANDAVQFRPIPPYFASPSYSDRYLCHLPTCFCTYTPHRRSHVPQYSNSPTKYLQSH